MTTVDMMFAPVGELATERRQEARKIFWALLAALFIHLIVGSSLALFGGFRPGTPAPVEDEPVELTIMDTSTAQPKPKNSMFVETDESKATAEQPKDKTFESNANSIAASEAAATGGMPLPSQEGVDRPDLELNNQRYALANQGAQAQPSVAPQESPKPSEAPTPVPTAAPDQLAMLTRTPTPPPQSTATAAPRPPASAYRPERRQTRLSGNISNRGISAVNAVGTPLGRYQKIVTDAVGSRWYAYTQSKSDLINIGTVRVHFVVDRSGKIRDLKILDNSSNETFANICLQSILNADLPPIPDDVAATLPSEGMEWDGITFTIYPN